MLKPCILGVAITLAGATALADDEYAYTHVPAPSIFGIPECYLRCINDAGLAVGTATVTVQDPQGNFHTTYAGIKWTGSDGVNAIDDAAMTLTGVSETGWVSGFGTVTHLPTGQTYYPPTLPGTYGPALLMGINDAGVAVGYILTCVCSNSQGLQQVPYVWSAAGGAYTISVADAKELVKVNNAGVAVGNIRGGAGGGDGFIYDLSTGQATLLSSVLPAPPPGVFYKIVASDINDLGVVTGYMRENTTLNEIGFMYSPAAGVTLMTPPSGPKYLAKVRPTSISEKGTVVGTIGLTQGVATPFVYDSVHGVRDLATLTTSAPVVYSYWYGAGINNIGWITVYGWTSTGGFSSGVLKPLVDCYADCESDGDLDIFDFLCFQGAYAGQLSYADCEQDGDWDVFDFLCFQGEFANGCD